MSDRELLELAAKAAGIAITNYVERIDDFYGPWNGADAFELDEGGYWNPLSDDGDALRLAVKVKKFPSLLHDTSGVTCGYEHVKSRRGGYFNPIVEQFGDDPMTATRRAIVRAAAEIGRSMP